MAEDVVYTAVVNVSTNAPETEQVVRDALEGMVSAAKQSQSALEATGGTSGLLRSLQDLIGVIDNFKTAMESVRNSTATEFSTNGASAIKTAYEEATQAVRSTLAAMAEQGQVTSRPLSQIAQGVQNTLATTASQGSRQIISEQRTAGATNLPNAGQLDTFFRNLQTVPASLQKTFAPVDQAAESLAAALRDATSSSKDRSRAALTALNQGLINQQETPAYPGLSNYPHLLDASGTKASFTTPAGLPYTFSPNGLNAVTPPRVPTEAELAAQQAAADKAAQQAAALAAQQAAQQEAADNAARASRISAQLGSNAPVGTLPLANGAALSAAEGGVVDANGKLITSMEELVAVTRAAGPALERAAKAQDTQNRSLGGSYLHGLFQGGWAGGQNDGSNPLGGLLETAGVLTKYALVGRSLQEVSRLARETFTDYANLDKAIDLYNQVIGGSDAANNTFVNSLENISRAAGVNVVDALNAATKGVAAFSTGTTTASQKQQIGQQFVTAATQNAVITGQPVAAASEDIIAVGTSFGIAAGGLNQINDAIATAHSLFGSSTLDISNGLKLLADDGKQAGYSMTELTQVIGLDAARLAESGDEVATNLQRVFAQFQSKAGQGALEGVGVDTSGTVKSQIEGLATVYDGLSTKQQQFILNTLGGAKAMKELVPLITDNTDLQNAFAKALDDSGAGANLANAQMNSLAGQLKVIGETIKNVGLDVARSGIFEPLIIAIGALKPALQTLDSLLQFYDKLPNAVKGWTASLVELGVALKVITDLRAKALETGATGGIGARIGGLFGRGGGGPEATTASGINARSAQVALNQFTEATVKQSEAEAAAARVTEDLGFSTQEVDAAQKLLAEQTEATSLALSRLLAVAQGATIGRGGNLIGGPVSAADEEATTAVAAEAVLEDSSFQQISSQALADARVATGVGLAGDAALAGDVGAGASGLGSVASDAKAGVAGALANTRSSIIGALDQSGEATTLRAAVGSSIGQLGTKVGAALLSSTGLVVGGIVAAIAVDSAIRQTDAYTKAIGNANTLGNAAETQTASNSPDTLAASADALRTQADAAKKASNSIFGSFDNLITGGTGRAAAAYDDRQATVLSTEAVAKEKIQNTAGSTNTATDLLDFSGVTALQTSISTLSANGFDAADTTRALNTALQGLASSAGAAIGKVGAQQAGVEAQASSLLSLNTVSREASRGVSDKLQQQYSDANGGRGGQAEYEAQVRANPLGGGDTFLSRQLTGTVRGNISSAVGAVESSYIGNHPEMTADQQAQLEQLADQQVKANLPDWDKLTQAERNAILTGINSGVLSAVKTAKTAGTINGATDLQSLTAAATTATAGAGAIGTEAGNSAYSNGGDIASATAKASLSSLQQTYTEVAEVAKKSGYDASALLNSIQDQIYAAEQAVDTAAIAHAQALNALAQSMVSPFDKAGQIAAQLTGAVQTLQSAKGADAQLAAQTALNNIASQQLQQQAADIGSSALDTAGYNTVNIDKAKQVAAQAQLDAARSQYAAPGTPGYNPSVADDQGTKDALKAVQDAQVQTLEDAAKQQASVAAAQIDPRSVLALDSSTISGLILQIKATPTSDQDTLAQLNTQLKAARVQQLQDSIAVSNASIAASVYPGSAVDSAAAALTEATNTLAGDEQGTAQWFTDYAALKAAQIGLGQATLKAAQAAGNLLIDTTNPVAVAQKALSDAQGQLAFDQSKKAPADVINADKSAVSTANQQELSAQFTQNISDATTASQLGQISHQAYLTYLKTQQQQLREQQAGMVAGTEGYRQLTDELNVLGQDILAANNQLIGQFNIGDINVPTPYEVRRSLATQAVGQQYQTSNNVVINVNGTNYDSVVQLLGTYLGPVTTGQYTLSARKVS